MKPENRRSSLPAIYKIVTLLAVVVPVAFSAYVWVTNPKVTLDDVVRSVFETRPILYITFTLLAAGIMVYYATLSREHRMLGLRFVGIFAAAILAISPAYVAWLLRLRLMLSWDQSLLAGIATFIVGVSLLLALLGEVKPRFRHSKRRGASG